MRKIILHFAITLDGMVSNVEQWVSLDDEALKNSSTDQDKIDAIIVGKNTYAGLTAYSAGSGDLFEISRRTRLRKEN